MNKLLLWLLARLNFLSCWIRARVPESEWSEARYKAREADLQMTKLLEEDSGAIVIEQEWSRQDVIVSVPQRYSTHLTFGYMVLMYKDGIVASHPAAPGQLHLAPETARQLGEALIKTAERAERERREWLKR